MPAAKFVTAERRGDRQAEKAGEKGLGHRRHAHEVGAEDARHPDLGGSLEARAGEPRIDALSERDPFRPRRRGEAGAQGRIVGVGHRDEAGIARLADQRVHAREIDVVGEQGEAARPHLRPQRPGGVGQQQGARTQVAGAGERNAHHGGVARLVGMGASLEDQDRPPGDQAPVEPSAMAADPRPREAGDRRVVEAPRFIEPGGQRPEAGAANDGAGIGSVETRLPQGSEGGLAHGRVSGPKEAGSRTSRV